MDGQLQGNYMNSPADIKKSNVTKSTYAFIVLIFLIVVLSPVPRAQALAPAWNYSMATPVISDVAVSNDGATIIVAAGKLFIFSKNGDLIKQEPYGDKVVLTPDGRYAASSFGSTLYFFRTPLIINSTDQQLVKIWDYEFTTPVRSIDMPDAGSTIAATTEGSSIYIFTTVDQKLYSDKTFENAIFKISHDRRRIVGISADKLRLYSTNARVSKSYNLASVSQPEFMFLSQTIPLIIYNDGPRVHAVDASLGEELWNVEISGTLKSLAMNPSGSCIVAGTGNGTIYLYEETGTLNGSYVSGTTDSLSEGITDIALSKNGALVAAGTKDGKVLFLNGGGELRGQYQAPDEIQHVAVSGDGSIVIATNRTTVYAFSFGSSIAAPSYYQYIPKNQTPALPNTSSSNTTTPTQTRTQIPTTITELPTTYSIIRTPTQSPSSLIIVACSLVIALIVLAKKEQGG